ncbi:MAG: hypothetical protein ACI9LM_002510 [Alteromonadaceae bacterium]|jgi:uncharacterized protein (DUF885 family)
MNVLSRLSLSVVIVSLSLLSNTVNALEQTSAAKLLQSYQQGLNALNIPKLALSYVTNLKNMGSMAEIEQQRQFFERNNKALDIFLEESKNNIEFLKIKYEIELNLERLSLEKKFRQLNQGKQIPETGLANVTMGKEWYKHFLKRWLSVDTPINELTEFGMQQIKVVQANILAIQNTAGFVDDNDGFYQYLKQPKFALKDENAVVNKYAEIDSAIRQNVGEIFEVTDIVPVKIAPIPDATKDSPPGTYRRHAADTFSFNFWQNTHNKRGMDFLYIHEAIPGHHYHLKELAKHHVISGDNATTLYSVFMEGWAAYCEELGVELGVYKKPTDWYGKYEWDLVRSVRVVMDIGLNHHQWSDKKAHQFWQDNITGQDDIAQREIDRMRRWPAQVLTYKVGAAHIMKLKEATQKRLGAAFNIKQFHSVLLNDGGTVPLKLLATLVKKANEL